MYKTLNIPYLGKVIFKYDRGVISFLYFQGSPVDAIVLEAPFTNMWTASINYPLLKVSLLLIFTRCQSISTHLCLLTTFFFLISFICL